MTSYYFRGLTVERGIHDDHEYRQALVDQWCSAAERNLEHTRPKATDAYQPIHHSPGFRSTT